VESRKETNSSDFIVSTVFPKFPAPDISVMTTPLQKKLSAQLHLPVVDKEVFDLYQQSSPQEYRCGLARLLWHIAKFSLAAATAVWLLYGW